MLHPLEEITQTFAWVVGPWYPNGVTKSAGYRAVKGWMVLSLGDDAAEEAVTLRATTPQELLEKVRAYEAEQQRKLDQAK